MPEKSLLTPVNPPGSVIPGISDAILIESGRLLVLSGHVPLDDEGNVAVGGLIEQLDQVFRNIDVTLRQAGADFGSLARLTFYVRDYRPDQLENIRNVRDRWINSAVPPASALIGVASLFRDDVLVEVDGLAVLPST